MDTSESNIVNIVIGSHQNAIACFLTKFGLGGSNQNGLLLGLEQESSLVKNIAGQLKGNFRKFANGCVIKLVVNTESKMVTISLGFAGLFNKPEKSQQPYSSETITLADSSNYETFMRLICPELLQNNNNKIFNFYLIRHGQGLHNVSRPGFAPNDAPLTEIGKLDGFAAGLWIKEDLNGGNVDLFCCSDLLRTLQTVHFLNKGLNYKLTVPETTPITVHVLPSNFEINDVLGKEGEKCSSFGIVGANIIGLSVKTKENAPYSFYDWNSRKNSNCNTNNVSNDAWEFKDFTSLKQDIYDKLDKRIKQLESSNNSETNLKVVREINSLNELSSNLYITPRVNWDIYRDFWNSAYVKNRKQNTNICKSNRRDFRNNNPGNLSNIIIDSNMIRDAINVYQINNSQHVNILENENNLEEDKKFNEEYDTEELSKQSILLRSRRPSIGGNKQNKHNIKTRKRNKATHHKKRNTKKHKTKKHKTKKHKKDKKNKKKSRRK